MISFSVIVPVHDDGPVVERALQSVDAAIRAAIRPLASAEPLRPEVLVVDDGSVDDSARLIRRFVEGRPGYRVVSRTASSSAGTARNVGVAASAGELLFFLDGDDVFLDAHIAECLRAMADPAVDFVKTGVALSDPVHPDWHRRICNSVAINLCVRRGAHDRIGGFPDYHLFRRAGDRFAHECDAFAAIEDVYYNRLLGRFCRGVALEAETVKHFRYPGNSFDRQYEKFLRPVGAYREAVDEDREIRVRLAEILLEHHIRKRCTPSPPRSVGGGVAVAAAAPEGQSSEEARRMDGPSFTADWFTQQSRDWPRFLGPFRGRPDLEFLEVGAFEGRATLWLLRHILTAPSSRITCVDTFAGSPEHRELGVDTTGLEARFDRNIAAVNAADKVRKIRGRSQEVLRGLPLRRYDFAYIDGSHRACDVLEDAILVLRLLKVGAVLIFDDYRWGRQRGDPQHPRVAVDAFMQLYGSSFEVVEVGYQAVLRKTAES